MKLSLTEPCVVLIRIYLRCESNNGAILFFFFLRVHITRDIQVLKDSQSVLKNGQQMLTKRERRTHQYIITCSSCSSRHRHRTLWNHIITRRDRQVHDVSIVLVYFLFGCTRQDDLLLNGSLLKFNERHGKGWSTCWRNGGRRLRLTTCVVAVALVIIIFIVVFVQTQKSLWTSSRL